MLIFPNRKIKEGRIKTKFTTYLCRRITVGHSGLVSLAAFSSLCSPNYKNLQFLVKKEKGRRIWVPFLVSFLEFLRQKASNCYVIVL